MFHELNVKNAYLLHLHLSLKDDINIDSNVKIYMN